MINTSKVSLALSITLLFSFINLDSAQKLSERDLEELQVSLDKEVAAWLEQVKCEEQYRYLRDLKYNDKYFFNAILNQSKHDSESTISENRYTIIWQTIGNEFTKAGMVIQPKKI